MTCPRCHGAMEELRGSHHKQRKWRCPRCGKIRFQAQAPRKPSRTRRAVEREGGR